MKKKKSKKQTNSNLKDQKLGQTKNSAKLVLFVFGIGPIIGIIIFLYSKGFFIFDLFWIFFVFFFFMYEHYFISTLKDFDMLLSLK